MLIRYTLAWLPMAVLAILNGAAREKLYGPRMSKLAAHQLSCILGILLFSLYTFCLGRLWPLSTANQAAMAGLIWLSLTLAFEFCMTMLLMGMSLKAALADYNLRAGRLWVLVLAAVAVLPLAVFRLS